MNYQEIYKGLNKKASAEQVKELAGMIKKAQLKKKAGPYDLVLREPAKAVLHRFNTGRGPSRILGAIFGNSGSVGNLGKMIPGAPSSVLSRIGKAGLKYGAPAVALTGGGYALGNAGKAELKGALDKANETSTKLVEENKKLKAGSGSLWEDILKALGQWWGRLSKSWNAGAEKTPAAPATTATEAAKK